MTTMLALMMVAHMGSPNLGNLYSREAEKRFWLIGSSHGMWEGRRAGPYSERETSATIEQQRIRRANISLALPADLGRTFR